MPRWLEAIAKQVEFITDDVMHPNLPRANTVQNCCVAQRESGRMPAQVDVIRHSGGG
jgi:hypothetical protein